MSSIAPVVTDAQVRVSAARPPISMASWPRISLRARQKHNVWVRWYSQGKQTTHFAEWCHKREKITPCIKGVT
eukprot:scaffold315242_cov15-Tisochrysis_lutea.AAC.1